jgi:anti-anti-sigma regulatory factor
MSPVLFKIDAERLVQTLQDASEKVDGADGALTLDFSAVNRINPAALKAMETLAAVADGKSVKVVLRGTNVDIYKVLKLSRLASRFSFVA